jgi:hypothetical protein
LPKRFGNSTMLAKSIPIAELQGRPLGDHPAVKYGRKPGVLREPRQPLEASTVAEAVSVISCWYVYLGQHTIIQIFIVILIIFSNILQNRTKTFNLYSFIRSYYRYIILHVGMKTRQNGEKE